MCSRPLGRDADKLSDARIASTESGSSKRAGLSYVILFDSGLSSYYEETILADGHSHDGSLFRRCEHVFVCTRYVTALF